MLSDLNYYPADEENYNAKQPSGSNFFNGNISNSYQTYDQTNSYQTYDQTNSHPTYNQTNSYPTYDQIKIPIQPMIKPNPIYIKLFTVTI
jgi:hypothetical protein